MNQKLKRQIKYFIEFKAKEIKDFAIKAVRIGAIILGVIVYWALSGWYISILLGVPSEERISYVVFLGLLVWVVTFVIYSIIQDGIKWIKSNWKRACDQVHFEDEKDREKQNERR